MGLCKSLLQHIMSSGTWKNFEKERSELSQTCSSFPGEGEGFFKGFPFLMRFSTYHSLPSFFFFIFSSYSWDIKKFRAFSWALWELEKLRASPQALGLRKIPISSSKYRPWDLTKFPFLLLYMDSLGLGKNPSYLNYGHETCFYCRVLDGNFLYLVFTKLLHQQIYPQSGVFAISAVLQGALCAL